MRLIPCERLLPWPSPPSIVFRHAMLAIDSVLLPREHEQHHHEHDERALRGHVEAERELEDRYGELVQGVHKHMDDKAEEDPDPEMRQHQSGRSPPVGFIVVALLHGRVVLPGRAGRRRDGRRDDRCDSPRRRMFRSVCEPPGAETRYVRLILRPKANIVHPRTLIILSSKEMD